MAKVVGKIGQGLNLLVGIAPPTDTPAELDWMAQKCLNLRIFSLPGSDTCDLSVQRHSGRNSGDQPVHPLWRLPQGPDDRRLRQQPRRNRQKRCTSSLLPMLKKKSGLVIATGRFWSHDAGWRFITMGQ